MMSHDWEIIIWKTAGKEDTLREQLSPEVNNVLVWMLHEWHSNARVT